MKSEQYLANIGLSAYQVKIYLALLDLGTANISELVRATQLHRPIVYQQLELLLEKQLVSFSPKKRGKIYYAESPERLQLHVDAMTKQFQELLPELKEKYVGKTRQPKMRYFSGEDVVTVIYSDVLETLKKGEVFYRYESPKDYKKFDEWLPPEYFERICKRKEIEKFVITNEKTFQTKKKVMEKVERHVPAKFDPFLYDITQIIYGEKVAFIDFESKTAWIIENQRFALFQRQLFRLLFQSL